MKTRPVEAFLPCVNLAGIIVGRSVIITDATGRATDLSDNLPFTLEGLRVDQVTSMTTPKEPLLIIAGPAGVRPPSLWADRPPCAIDLLGIRWRYG